MSAKIAKFWNWFSRFADRVATGAAAVHWLDELLAELQRVDRRIYFELSSNTDHKELVLTACGNVDAFPVIDRVVASAPRLRGWSFVALKPAQGFEFVYRSNEVELNANELWFMPLRCEGDSKTLGIRIGVANADFVLGRQSVDTGYTILETGLGERECATAIQHVELFDLPFDPAAEGYLELSRLPEYLAWVARRRAT